MGDSENKLELIIEPFDKDFYENLTSAVEPEGSVRAIARKQYSADGDTIVAIVAVVAIGFFKYAVPPLLEFITKFKNRRIEIRYQDGDKMSHIIVDSPDDLSSAQSILESLAKDQTKKRKPKPKK